MKVRVIHPKCITTAISRIAKIDKLHQAKVVHGQTQGKKLKDIWGKIAGSLNLTWHPSPLPTAFSLPLNAYTWKNYRAKLGIFSPKRNLATYWVFYQNGLVNLFIILWHDDCIGWFDNLVKPNEWKVRLDQKFFFSWSRLTIWHYRLYLSKIPTYNSHFNSHLNSHFLLSRSGNSFLKNSHFSKKISQFYLIESGNLSGGKSGNYKWKF